MTASARVHIARSAAIQSLGAGASFSMTIVVALLGGPIVQGQFALIKSMNDALVSFLSLGLPAGLVYAINRHDFPAARVPGMALKFAVATFPLSLVISSLIFLSQSSSGMDVGLVAAGAVAAASAGGIYFGLMRALILTRNDDILFAVISIVPAILLLVTIAVIVSIGESIAFAYVVSSGVAAIVSAVVARRLLDPSSGQSVRPSRDVLKVLARQSTSMYVQSTLMTLQPLATVSALAFAGAGQGAVGLFNLAVIVIVGPNLLIGLVAPVLLNRWTKGLTDAGLRSLSTRVLALGLGCQLLALASIPLVRPVVSAVLGAEYAASAPAIAILLLATLPLVVTRVIAPALQSQGTMAPLNLSCFVRLMVVLALFVILPSSSSLAVRVASWTWVAAEYAACAVLIWPLAKVWKGAPVNV